LPPVSALFFVQAHRAQAQSSGGFTIQVVALAKKAKVSHQHITLAYEVATRIIVLTLCNSSVRRGDGALKRPIAEGVHGPLLFALSEIQTAARTACSTARRT
jgi:hypothetical protein